MAQPAISNKVWHRARIEEEKASIRAELDKAGGGDDPRQRLWVALEKLQESSELTPLHQLRRYVYIVSALIQHAHFGGLKPRQVGKLVSLAEAILATQGVHPNSPKLGFLYAELYLAVSQIHTQQGRHWESLWEQQLATYLSPTTSGGGAGFQALALGIRSLRLGHARFAADQLEKAESAGLTPPYLSRAKLERLKALRLCGDLDGADRVPLEVTPGFSAAEKRELEWEKLCRESQRTGSVSSLVLSVQKNKSHHSPAYLCEALLWSRIVKSREWIQRFPTARSMARNPHASLKSSYLFDWVTTFESCYDPAIPGILRLRRLGLQLADVAQLPSIDTELLVWAAAARWLARNRMEELAEVVRREYRGLSLRLSEGKHADVLGLLSDLQA